MSVRTTENQSPLAIICGGGSIPFAVADAAQRHGREVMLFALRGWADPQRVAKYPHHWGGLAEFGRFLKLAHAAHCHDVVMVGTVLRPSLWQLRPDWGALRLLPRLITLWRGGDDHLLSGVTRILEENGFRLFGAHEVAPDILLPSGLVGRHRPAARDVVDIVHGLALLNAMAPFDVGQGAVVAGKRVLAVEAAEGTDAMLERVAAMRREQRIGLPVRCGVLVKAPKQGQELRVDMPAIGPQTVDGAAAAGLAGIAVLAGSTIAADPEEMIALADRSGIFVAGVSADGTLV